jgi:hypothetical protein
MRVTLNGRELVFDPSGALGWNWTDQPNGELVLSAADCAEASVNGSEARAELVCAITGTGS